LAWIFIIVKWVNDRSIEDKVRKCFKVN